MATKFHSVVHRREEVTYLKLAGVIDEDNDLGVLADQMGPGPLIIDLSEIERINSCGVRDWVNWLGRVEKAGGKPILVECSPSIVAQVNLVNNFTGVGAVKSFYAPYFCPHCDREKVLLIETRDAVAQASYRAPTCRCDECDGPMDFDDMEDSYFAFLSNSAKVITDARVDEVITEFTPSESGPKLRSRTSPGPSAGGIAPTMSAGMSSLPSVPSLPSMSFKKGDAYTALTTGKHLLSSPPTSPGLPPPPVVRAEMSLASATLPSMNPARPPPAPSMGRGWMLVVGMLVVAALGLVAFLSLGSSGSSSASTSSRRR